ncbi:MAG: hypothetical protein ACRD4Q_02445 [Candidatus Acidiferrales bacterium]
MATRKKMPLLDLTITERLPIEVLRQEQRQSCDEIMHRAGLRWKNNTQRNLRTLGAGSGSLHVQETVSFLFH